MSRWQKIWLWLCGDLCRRCHNGKLRRSGISGYAILKIHMVCENCGAKTAFTQES